MNILRKVVKGFVIIAAFLLILFFSLSGPINRSPIQSEDFYQSTLANVDSVGFSIQSGKSKLSSGWIKVNITPSYPMPLAGYTLRENFKTVHDSLYCRILAIRSGDATAVILSADLLLFPPELKNRIQNHFIQKKSNSFFFFSATHTHNGIGGWDDSLIGNLALGDYDEKWVNTTAENIVHAMESLEKSLMPSALAYFETEPTEYAVNRVDVNSPADSKLRGLKIIRSDSTKAILFTFSAHATSINKRSLALSGDYPSAVIKNLEESGYEFATYLSGMVGSHRLEGIDGQEFEMVAKTGEVLSAKIQSATFENLNDSLILRGRHLPLGFASSQLRIAKDWKIRDWVFRLVLNKLEGELTVLEIGNVIMIGTPCDFSGEISVQDGFDAIAEAKRKKLIITSFNGNYDGYITADHHYDTSEKEEIRALNWVGPYYGTYFSEVIKKIIAKSN